MQKTTGMDPSILSGWLKDYVSTVAGTRFPTSYHVLSGIFCLSTCIGRKAGLVRPGYVLWPPTSILLLGHSGVGKSASLRLALDVLKKSVDLHERPQFVLLLAREYTTSGLEKMWSERQQEMSLGFLEGAVAANELKAILRERTGTENAAQFLIEVAEHRDLSGITLGRGETVVRNQTFSFAFCSTVQYLRKSVSVDDFGGGLMHRFLISHEVRKKEVDEAVPAEAELDRLGLELRNIQLEAPAHASIQPDGERFLVAQRNLAESRRYPSTHLTGFWNRFDAIVAKLGLSFAISDGRFDISLHDLERAETLVKLLYEPLEELVLEMSHGVKEQKLYELAEDLQLNGSKGVSLNSFLKRLPGTSLQVKYSTFEMMKSLELCHEHDSRVFAGPSA